VERHQEVVEESRQHGAPAVYDRLSGQFFDFTFCHCFGFVGFLGPTLRFACMGLIALRACCLSEAVRHRIIRTKNGQKYKNSECCNGVRKSKIIIRLFIIYGFIDSRKRLSHAIFYNIFCYIKQKNYHNEDQIFAHDSDGGTIC
jgi:hypothetical protein